MAAQHTAAEVILLFNCVLILSLNDHMTTTNHGKTNLSELQYGIMLVSPRFVDLLRTPYDHIPRKASIITNENLLAKVQYLYYQQ